MSFYYYDCSTASAVKIALPELLQCSRAMKQPFLAEDKYENVLLFRPYECLAVQCTTLWCLYCSYRHRLVEECCACRAYAALTPYVPSFHTLVVDSKSREGAGYAQRCLIR